MNALKTKVLCAASVIALATSTAQAQEVDWTGIYAGINAGIVSGDADFKDADGNILSPDISGGVAGGQAGFNFQNGLFVFGLEGDFQATNADGSATDVDIIFGGKGTTTITTRKDVGLDWIATIRGRAGVTTGNFLFYGTAGVAFADLDIVKSVENEIIFAGKGAGSSSFTTVQSASNIEVGWTAGGGIEGQITEDISAWVQALYVDLGSNDVLGHSVDTQFTVINFGVNFKFGGG